MHFHTLGEKPLDDTIDRLSIVSLARGNTVVSRTGELMLDSSALRAIDDDPQTVWLPPPNDLPQSMTIALPARARIDRVGIRTDETLPVKHVMFEGSSDGVTFREIATIGSKETIDPQWFDVPSSEATHLRVTIVDRVTPGREVRIRSILVGGSELEAPHPGELAGCWSLNDTTARFERHGSSVTGVATMGKIPMQLDGGFDGRGYRFNWTRGNDYGYAFVAVSPDGRHFNAIEWHEEAIPLFNGDSWFGEKSPACSTPPIEAEERERYLRRAGRYSLFGIRFHEDGSIDREESADSLRWLARFSANNPVQLVAHEFRRGTPAQNRAIAQRELVALRAELERAGATTNITYVAKGSDAPRQEPASDVARALYSTVDVEIRR